MSEKGSVFQKGGGGTNFEQNVQTAFLVTMLVGGDVPFVPSSTIFEIALQVTNRGFETDDLMVVAKSDNDEHRLLIQIKHEIAFTLKSALWKEVLTAFWKDFNNFSFNKEKDKLIVVTGGLSKNDRNHLKTLFNWANTHSSASDFLSEVNRIKAKREQLDVFRTILNEANNNTELSDEVLWEFVKCVDVLEYDFLNEGSVSKTNFLNLIKLCKNNTSILDEEEIWNSLYYYVSDTNLNGGSITLESVKGQDFYKQFDITKILPYSNDIIKLQKDSNAILRPIKSSVGFGKDEIHFQRTVLLEGLSNSINKFQFTFVVGKPGMGKTAVIKDLMNKDYSNASIFVFRADQFNAPTIANVFSSVGINESIEDIFSCVSLIPEKIVFIDACEKLLESDPECAFREFLALIKTHPDVKVVLTSRKYAFDLLSLKFDINYETQQTIEIPPIDDNELKAVSDRYANLNILSKNESIKELLLCPKYLDFALRTIDKTNNDLSSLSVTGFKELLWNKLVADSQNTKNGMPIKREKAFMSIAVKRAKEMKLFTKPDDNIDAEALVCLEKDEVIFQEKDNRKYSPTHDILEDWALVRYVSEKFEDSQNPKDFLMSLGTEPAIRRAFRLWVEDYLNEKNDRLIELIKISYADDSIGNYWVDEMLTAVFRSDNCAYFFKAFENELLLNDCTFLNKCLNVIKTCCKESFSVNNNTFLVPIGDGWKQILFFISNHPQQLDTIKLPIINFITDWYSKLVLKYKTVDVEEQKAAKSIVLFYIGEIEKGLFVLRGNEQLNVLIMILLDLASISQEEIRSLIKRCYENKKESWQLMSFYDKVKEMVLSGIGNLHLIKELPDLIIEVAWEEWKYIPEDEKNNNNRIFVPPHHLSGDECWGININHEFFPAGIYKTPFYNLLKQYPKEGLAFIVEFVNYAVDFYINASNTRYKHGFTKVDVVIDDETVVSKYACAELWTAFRGFSVTSHLLESLLMSLEKFLMEIAGIKSEESRNVLKYVFDYVIKNSNNVAPLAVLSSVTMAYPKEVGTAMLPLLGTKEFYDWDLDRALHEYSSVAPMDNKISFAQKERYDSNQLPHRKKYQRGLLDFVLDYQFNIRTLNSDLFKLLDLLKEKNLNNNDIVWEKTLLEIDARNHKIGDYDPKLGGYPIVPTYNKEVSDFIESNQEEYIQHQKSSMFAGELRKAWTGEEVISFEKWQECYEYYIEENDKTNILSNRLYVDRPVTLACIGLRDFSNRLLRKQKKWCIDTMFNTVRNIIKTKYSYGLNINISYNITEQDIALSSFHLLIKNMANEKEATKIVELMIHSIIAPFAFFEQEKICIYFRETFYDNYPEITKKIWFALINLSVYRGSHPLYHRNTNDIQNENKYIHSLVSNNKLKTDVTTILFDKCEKSLLYRIFVLTPIHFDDSDFNKFIITVLPMVINDLQVAEDYQNVINVMDYELRTGIERYLALCFLESDVKHSIPMFKMLIDSVQNREQIVKYGRNELLEFVEYVLDFVVIKLHDNGVLGIQENVYKKQTENFWSLWIVFYEMMPDDGTCPLMEKLMLDTRYLCFDERSVPDESDWSVLENQKEFYKKILLGKGKHHISSAIKVFSTIGNKAFMPDGISWIVEVLKTNLGLCKCLMTTHADRMIKRLFYDHISMIKSNRRFIEDYLWVLDKMVELGSSDAYFVRENVITYKKAC